MQRLRRTVRARTGPPTTMGVERIAGQEVVVIAAIADPRICNVFTRRDPEFAALRVRAEEPVPC